MSVICNYFTSLFFALVSFCGCLHAVHESFYEAQLAEDPFRETSKRILMADGSMPEAEVRDFLTRSEETYKNSATLSHIAGSEGEFRKALYCFHVRWTALSLVLDGPATAEREKEQRSFSNFLDQYDVYYDQYDIDPKVFMQRLWSIVSIYDVDKRLVLIPALDLGRLGGSNENADQSLDLSFPKNDALKGFLRNL